MPLCRQHWPTVLVIGNTVVKIPLPINFRVATLTFLALSSTNGIINVNQLDNKRTLVSEIGNTVDKIMTPIRTRAATLATNANTSINGITNVNLPTVEIHLLLHLDQHQHHLLFPLLVLLLRLFLVPLLKLQAALKDRLALMNDGDLNRLRELTLMPTINTHVLTVVLLLLGTNASRNLKSTKR